MKYSNNKQLDKLINDIINGNFKLEGSIDDPVYFFNKDKSYCIVADKYWDPFSEMFPFAEEIVSSLVNTGRLQGKTIINLISSQYSGIQTLGLDNKNDAFMDVININTPELEQIKNNYLRYVDEKICKKYDNVVCAIIDDPTDTDYPVHDCYIKNTILSTSKDKSYIINIGYPSKKVKDLDKDEFVKKLVIPNH